MISYDPKVCSLSCVEHGYLLFCAIFPYGIPQNKYAGLDADGYSLVIMMLVVQATTIVRRAFVLLNSNLAHFILEL